MTKDDIIRMAREAGMELYGLGKDREKFVYYLQEFAALVAAAEREAILKDGWRQCAKDQRTTQFCGMLQQAVLTEREACAKAIDEMHLYGFDDVREFEIATLQDAAKAIRARGQA